MARAVPPQAALHPDQAIAQGQPGKKRRKQRVNLSKVLEDPMTAAWRRPLARSGKSDILRTKQTIVQNYQH